VGSAEADTSRASSANARNMACTSGTIEASPRISRSAAALTFSEIATTMSDSSHSSSRTRASHDRASEAHRIRRSGEGDGSVSMRSSRSPNERSRRLRPALEPPSSMPPTSTSSRCSRARSRRRRSTGWAMGPPVSGLSSRLTIHWFSRSSSSTEGFWPGGVDSSPLTR
jgi:hypothetical protein